LDKHFLKFLSYTKKTLDMAFYEVRDENIMNKFIELHKAGVKIRLVVDNDYYFQKDHETGKVDESSYNQYIEPMLEAGMDVRQDLGRSGLMHNKFCVRDGKYVWVGSYNLTNTGAYNNENNVLEFQSKRLGDIYTRELEEMYEDEQFGTTSPSTIEDQSLELKDTKLQVVFAPEDDPLGVIERHLSQAQESIFFMQFAMTADELGAVLIEKFNQGLSIEGMFDRSLYRSTGPYAEFSKLLQAGIPMVVYESPTRGKLHHKVFIIDPGGENPMVITGSLNASANGAKSNDENIIVIQNAEITMAYYKQFRKLSTQMSEVTAGFKDVGHLRMNTVVDKATLLVSSNGRKTKSLKIQLPARWPDQEGQMGMRILRLKDGERVDTTEKEKIKISPKEITINSADLKSKGEGALLIIELLNITTPSIAGQYNLYIRARNSFARKYHPLAIQPVLTIVGEEEDTELGPEEAILQELVQGEFGTLDGLLDACKKDGECEIFYSRGFVTKGMQILKQRILIENSKEAKVLLKKFEWVKSHVLPDFRSDRKEQFLSNQAEIFDKLY